MSVFTKKKQIPKPAATLAELEAESARLANEHVRLTELRTELVAQGDFQPSGQPARIQALAADLLSGGGGTMPVVAEDIPERLAAVLIALERIEGQQRAIQSPLADARWKDRFEQPHTEARRKLAHAVVAVLQSFEEVRAVIAEARAAGAVQPCAGTSMLPLLNFSSCAAMGGALHAMRPQAPAQFRRDNASLLQ